LPAENVKFIVSLKAERFGSVQRDSLIFINCF